MKVVQGDITKVEDIDVIVNAANGIGVMGSGVAGAIARSGGDLLKENVAKVVREGGPYEAGELYISDAGLLKRRGVKLVYHAVTMKFPGGQTSLNLIGDLLRKVLETAISTGQKSIAFGGLGCGIGRLNKEEVAKRMAHISQDYDAKIDITVIDINEGFVREFLKNLSIKAETNEAEIDNNPPDIGPE